LFLANFIDRFHSIIINRASADEIGKENMRALRSVLLGYAPLLYGIEKLTTYESLASCCKEVLQNTEDVMILTAKMVTCNMLNYQTILHIFNFTVEC